MHVVVMPMVDLRREVVVEGDRQDDLAMKDAEQWLTQAKCQQRQERRNRAFTPQPRAHGMYAPPELPPSTVNYPNDAHTTTYDRPP